MQSLAGRDKERFFAALSEKSAGGRFSESAGFYIS